MENDRFAHIVKRQRSQLATIGWGLVALGALLLTFTIGNAIAGEALFTGRGLIAGIVLTGAGIGSLVRSRQK